MNTISCIISFIGHIFQEEQSTSETSPISDVNSYENRMNDANMMIEIHSGFDQLDSGFDQLDSDLTYDVSDTQGWLSEMAMNLEKTKKVFIESNMKNRSALFAILQLEQNIENGEEIMNYIQVSAVFF